VVTQILLFISLFLFHGISDAMAAALPGSPYKWKSASPAFGHASRNFTLKGTPNGNVVAAVRKGGELIVIGGSPVIDLPGTRDVHIEVEGFQSTRMITLSGIIGTTYAGLTFKQPCVLAILGDGTLVADKKHVQAYDVQGKWWISKATKINGRTVFVFSDDYSSDKALDAEGLIGYTHAGDGLFKRGARHAYTSPLTGGKPGTVSSYQTVGKNCGRCGKPVSLGAKVGQRCPHCGAYWGGLDSKYQTAQQPQAGMQSCFIATAAYGSPMEEHVVSLRTFRDRYLITHTPGRWLVDFYYRNSPPIAASIADKPWLKSGTRLLLTPCVVLARASLGSPKDIALVTFTGIVGLLFMRRVLRSRRLASFLTRQAARQHP